MLISDRLGELPGKSLVRTAHYSWEQESSRENREGPRHGVISPLLWFYKHPLLKSCVISGRLLHLSLLSLGRCFKIDVSTGVAMRVK